MSPDSSSTPSSPPVALIAIVATVGLVAFAPDIDIGPYDAINPQRLARIAAAVLGIAALGALAQRALGDRYGLLISGFVAGFVSSSATIAAMGTRARANPAAMRAAVAGGMASSVATVLEYFVIVAAVDPSLVATLLSSLGLALVVAVVATGLYARRATSSDGASESKGAIGLNGPAFHVLQAFLVAGGSGIVSIAAEALEAWIGRSGPIVASAIAGLVDAHSTTGALASLHDSGRIGAASANLAIVVALSTNSVTKILLAAAPGGKPYALRITIGVVAIAAAAWIGWLLRWGL